ncbi:o-succinylbenzoate--CoA ligase [Endozoicomonas sp. SCSIO W0465]|uniref:o-succinylbenzoate--CoA ligase n=1 Tax=Endozoicomonas sp. SCSIO W0465 TaxID=2918516 RepID=UPI002074C64A|nr:o-succinylbenzoate--CoA ligase [Endozoicomonas sp. SCSIO W0465]USE34443.1 o-succinylbenzoate--CoA ligase [Endozoicomonas sp. SCSIO W0465]
MMKTIFPELQYCPLRHRAIHQGSCTAIQLEEGCVTFRLLDERVDECCRVYRGQGMRVGSRLLFVTSKPLDTVVVALACLRSQWIFCPVNPAFPEEQRSGYRDRIGATLVADSSGIGFHGCRTAKRPRSESALRPIEVLPDAVYDLIATSGTTGVPKAVAHSYKNHYFSALGSMHTLPLTYGDTWLLSLPLFHVGGLAIVFRCLLAGVTMVLFERKLPLEEILARKRLTHLSLVNTQLYRLVQSGLSLYDAGVRYILLGGGVASPKLVEEAKAQGVTVLTTYGMTEMASQICGEPLFTGSGVTSGAVLPWRKVRLTEEGEIQVCGETLAMGYFQNGVITPLSDNHGWFYTGDKGRWVGEQLQVCGRMDNMLISGGENIHPEEIEQALLAIPEIVQAVVVSMTDPEYGQRPVAYVQTVDGTLNESFTKERLAGKIASSRPKTHQAIIIRLYVRFDIS